MSFAAHLAGAEQALMRGDGQGAVRHALDGLALQPSSPEAGFILGLAWNPAWFLRVLALAPDHLGAALNLAQTLIGAGHTGPAARVLRRFLAATPAATPALVNLALLSAPASTRTGLRRAAALAPDDALVRLNLGATLDRLGDKKAAAREHRRAAVLGPSHAIASLNVALACFSDGDGAGRWHGRCLALDPASAEAMAGLGAVARHRQQRATGRSWDRKALALRPDQAPALANIGHGDVILGEAASALPWLRRAEQAQPGEAAYGNTALAVAYYLPVADPDELLARCRRWVRRHVPAAAARRGRGASSGLLKVGILSNDLGDHPVGWTILSLFERHRRVQLHAYVDGGRDEPMARRFQTLAESWTDIAGLSDAEVAERMRRDELDLLVVVAGRTLRTRLLVAAHGGAPIQASLYDFGTSGADAMNWVVTDDVLHPPESPEKFTEGLWRLPSLFLARPPENLPAIRDERSQGTTFISCNHPAKMTADVMRLWARVLAAVPGSRLVLKYGSTYAEEPVRRRILWFFASEGIAADRLVFMTEHLTRERHLALLSDANIALDPFPFNGSTTTLEALWMGVPVVTLAGNSFVSRMGASMLTALGRPELIAASEADYVAKAAALAADRGRLAAMQRALRDEVLNSVLGDAAAYSDSLENMFVAMAS